MLGLYIHIPFCKQICSYCDFPKMVANISSYKSYFEALFNELDLKLKDISKIDTIYIGGGTPNLLPLEMLEELFKKIEKYLEMSLETTIECNPDLITKEQVDLFKKYHINRVSMGVETTNSNILSLLRRTHKKEDILKAIDLLRENNINNINLDFIFGLPFETKEDLINDLDFYFSLNLPHASFYSLILEDKTILSYKLKNKEINLPEDDDIASMYDYINKRMKDMGYIHYEVSNYCKEGYESKHNLLYWNQMEYIGCGMGGAGYFNSYRYSNYKTLKNYINLMEEDRIYIDFEEKKKEYLLLGLRKLKGVSISQYKERFNSSMFDDFNLKKYLDTGLLKIENDFLYIPEDKMFISNQVLTEFV